MILRKNFNFIIIFTALFFLNLITFIADKIHNRPIQNLKNIPLPLYSMPGELLSITQVAVEDIIEVEVATEVETTEIPIPETTTKEIETTTKAQEKTKSKQENKSNFGVFKSYTDYHCLSRSSKQWKIQEKAYTDKNGLRKIGDAYLVALGSYYGTQLGTRYTVTLSNGSVFDIILCDCKQDRHTDSLHREGLRSRDVIEFYVDKKKLPKKVRTSGSVHSIEYFSGSVVSIKKAA